MPHWRLVFQTVEKIGVMLNQKKHKQQKWFSSMFAEAKSAEADKLKKPKQKDSEKIGF
mgnify:CR=1 FL=1